VFINNMLELPGNRRFAENLLRYLGERQGVVLLATPDTTVEGRYPSLGADDPLSGLETALSRLARIELPASAVRWLSAALVIALLVSAILALPRRSEYLRAASTPFAQTLAGDAGRARLFSREGGNLLVPLLVFEHELGVRLRESLRLPFDAEPHLVLAAMREQGTSPDVVEQARALLGSLGALKLAADAGRAVRVEPKRFRAAISAGERMLAALESAKSRARV
jgi:hypothetical protein